MKQRAWVLILLILLLSLVACGKPAEEPETPEDGESLSHTHKWEPANCSRGEFCFGCGETRGEALAHIWVDATCDKAKHCSLCQKTEGAMLAHSSDGNGNCVHCGQELNVYAMLDGHFPEKKSVVYGGAVLRFPFTNRFNDQWPSYADSGRFGRDYRIYDQNGVLVAEGAWSQKVLVTLYRGPEKDVCTPEYHDTDYISLSPGTYRIEFSYYKYWNALSVTEKMGDPEHYLIPPTEPPFSSAKPEEVLCYSSNWLEVR